jgi:hypothetical protein
MGAVISRKLPKMMEWAVASWISSVSCEEKKTLELDAIKFAEWTLEIPYLMRQLSNLYFGKSTQGMLR